MQHQEVTGPKGEHLHISWMPGNRVRIDFAHCGKVCVTKIFPSETLTNVEIGYASANSPAEM